MTWQENYSQICFGRTFWGILANAPTFPERLVISFPIFNVEIIIVIDHIIIQSIDH